MAVHLAISQYRRNFILYQLPFPRCKTLFTLRCFRSDAALAALAKASHDRVSNLVLYNYPSFSGAFSALFAHLFHSRLGLPCLILPFSSVVPLRIEDLHLEGLEKCYLLDCLGPNGFAIKLSQLSTAELICFDHRKSSLLHIPQTQNCPKNLSFHVNLEQSSARAVYEYFSAKFIDIKYPNITGESLVDPKDQNQIHMMLNYLEDGDLARWKLPDIRAFGIGLSRWRSKLNCLTNPFMYDQLLSLSYVELLANGNSLISSRQNEANKLLDKIFRIRLGRGFYGECLAVRADKNSGLAHEIGMLLSTRSASLGLRPIGAVVYMKRNNLKMSLRSTDAGTDTSEIAKNFGAFFARCVSRAMQFIVEYDAKLDRSSKQRKSGRQRKKLSFMRRGDLEREVRIDIRILFPWPY